MADEKPRAPRLEALEFVLVGRSPEPFAMRTEDVRFSPSGRLLAVVATQSRILLFAVDTGARPLRAEFLTALASSDLRAPHGVDWIDEGTLVIANRLAGLAFFGLPPAHRWQPETEISAIATAQPSWFGAPGEMRKLPTRSIMTGPGSVRVRGDALYAACSKANTVTRHRILAGPACDEGELVAQEGLDIPDSAVVSPDGLSLAIGDHGHRRVLIFRLGEPSPCGQLSDPRLVFPHGIVFDKGGTSLIAADAGGRGLYTFHAPGGAWNRTQTTAAVRTDAVSETVFDRVQAETPQLVRALEGGTKGVDLSRDGSVLVTTSRGQTLRFFAVHAGA